MKAYVQFVSEYDAASPVLEFDVASKVGLKNLIAAFKSNNVYPSSVMVDFIVFVHAAMAGKSVKILNESSISSEKEINTISTRIPNIVEFVYKKDDGKTDWRKIDLIEEDKYYVKGHDLNDNNSFKSFKKANIVGGRMIKQ